MAVAVEASAVKYWGCTADGTLPSVRSALQGVEGAGGHVQYVAMDEPFLGGDECGQAPDATAAEVALFALALRLRRPALQVGDI